LEFGREEIRRGPRGKILKEASKESFDLSWGFGGVGWGARKG